MAGHTEEAMQAVKTEMQARVDALQVELELKGRTQEDEESKQIEKLRGAHFKELQTIRNSANKATNELAELKISSKKKDDQLASLREQVTSLSEALQQRPYPLPPPSPHLDIDYIDGLKQKHELEVSKARERIRQLEHSSHDASDKAHGLSKQVVDMQEQIAKLNTLLLIERDKAHKAMVEMFEMTGAFGSKPKTPGNIVNQGEPRLSASAISPRSPETSLPATRTVSAAHTPLPMLSPTSQLPGDGRRSPSNGTRRASHGRSFSHAPTRTDGMPSSSPKDYPFPQSRSPTPGPAVAPSFNVISATPNLESDAPQFISPFNNPSPFDGYAPVGSTAKISPKAKHARRQSLQMLQVSQSRRWRGDSRTDMTILRRA
jgi:predicted  nucleic acid-binding Zn-ribbon protein